jgi:hypothetical protein
MPEYHYAQIGTPCFESAHRFRTNDSSLAAMSGESAKRSFEQPKEVWMWSHTMYWVEASL